MSVAGVRVVEFGTKFELDKMPIGKLEPGGREVGSSTREWLITAVPDRSSHYSSTAVVDSS